MQIIENKFIADSNNITKCTLLTHNRNQKNIILLYTNDDDILLFKYEEKSKSYRTDVYYDEIQYKLLLKKQKTSLTYTCRIYFDLNVPTVTQYQIAKN